MSLALGLQLSLLQCPGALDLLSQERRTFSWKEASGAVPVPAAVSTAPLPALGTQSVPGGQSGVNAGAPGGVGPAQPHSAPMTCGS